MRERTEQDAREALVQEVRSSLRDDVVGMERVYAIQRVRAISEELPLLCQAIRGLRLAIQQARL